MNFQRVIIESLERLYGRVLQFLPNLFTAALLLILGFILAAVLKWGFFKLFRAFNLDRFFERFGMGELLGKGGIREPLSVLLSKIIGWIIVFTFIIISLQALNVPAVEGLLEGFFLYLPNIFVAALILLFGYFLSNFLGRTVLIAAVNAGLKVSGLIGNLVRLSIFLLAVTMALEQLGIGRGTIIIAFAIIFGGVVLALSIAFGLGGRDIAKEYLEKKMKGEERKDDIKHL